MSISNLFEGNDYNLYCKSISVTPISIAIQKSSQTIPSGSNTVITWDTVLWETPSAFTFNPSSAPAIIRVLSNGLYLVNLFVQWESNNAAGQRDTFIAINLSETYGGTRITSANTTLDERTNISTVVQLASNDTISCAVFQNSGSNCVAGSSAGINNKKMILTVTKLYP